MTDGGRESSKSANAAIPPLCTDFMLITPARDGCFLMGFGGTGAAGFVMFLVVLVCGGCKDED